MPSISYPLEAQGLKPPADIKEDTQCKIYSYRSCVFHFFSLAKSFQQSYIESGGTTASFCNKVFASWDYCISDENTAKIKSQNIVQTVKVWAW